MTELQKMTSSIREVILGRPSVPEMRANGASFSSSSSSSSSSFHPPPYHMNTTNTYAVDNHPPSYDSYIEISGKNKMVNENKMINVDDELMKKAQQLKEIEQKMEQMQKELKKKEEDDRVKKLYGDMEERAKKDIQNINLMQELQNLGISNLIPKFFNKETVLLLLWYTSSSGCTYANNGMNGMYGKLKGFITLSGVWFISSGHITCVYMFDQVRDRDIKILNKFITRKDDNPLYYAVNLGDAFDTECYTSRRKFESIMRLIPGGYKNGAWRQLDGFWGMYFNDDTLELSATPPPFDE